MSSMIPSPGRGRAALALVVPDEAGTAHSSSLAAPHGVVSAEHPLHGLLVLSHSFYQCLGLVQLYRGEQCPFTLVSQQNLSQGLL